MKFVTIADSHGQHHRLILPKGDVIIHAGDVSRRGEENEVIDFLNWFSTLDYQHKIFIAGNHDFYFERTSGEEIKKIIPNNVTYLCDSGTTIENVKIWGSPVTPWFFDWAFNRRRGEPIARHWDLIPSDTDILITHGPAFCKLDKTKDGKNVGCKDLLDKVRELKPKFHVCGHIHEAYGQLSHSMTRFINASVLDENYVLKNAPLTFDV
ncbi:MAG: metallophosphatase domain-containing protein [Bacteroidetes bacterium]|nr:metallophosphatase domain-containing protein [Bacteroidota bacterium]